MLSRAVVAGITAAALAACLDQPAVPPDTAGVSGDAARGTRTDTVGDAAFELHLDALNAPRPERVDSDRNPFRFRGASNEGADDDDADDEGADDEGSSIPAIRPPAPAGVRAPAAGAHDPAARRRLRFIALVDAPRSGGFIAVLSDGDTVFQGRVGDTIDGRYRIMSIGIDSAEVELLLTGERQVLQRDGT